LKADLDVPGLKMKRAYQLDPTKLRPGDVILESGAGLLSRLIRVSDRGRFSHVILYLGANFIVEVTEDGVRIMQALRVVTLDPQCYLVLRHPEIEKLPGKTDEIISFIEQRLFASLMSELNKPYAWTGVLGTKLPFFRRRAHEHFCSQLVAEAFQRIGVPIFSKEIPCDKVTPKLFDTDSCILQRVDGCFVQLPDSEHLLPFARDRYKVLKSSPLPILELGSQVARDAVKVFGPRVDTAARKINRDQTVGSLQDLYRTLYIPDLPDGDKISDDLTAWLESRYPSEAIRKYALTTRRSFERIARSGDQKLLAVAIKTLKVDIDSIQRVLPVLENQLPSIKSARPPLKVRSIHRWLEKKLEDSISFERELLAWRVAFLQKFHGTAAPEHNGENPASSLRAEN
jgi:hypothetical protein